MSGDGVRKERIALNESAYREMNEWVVAGQAPARGELAILCECGDEHCSDAIRVPSNEYRAVRENPLRFVVAPHHLIADAEFLVEERAGYWVVEKFEEVADVMEATDSSNDLSA